MGGKYVVLMTNQRLLNPSPLIVSSFCVFGEDVKRPSFVCGLFFPVGSCGIHEVSGVEALRYGDVLRIKRRPDFTAFSSACAGAVSRGVVHEVIERKPGLVNEIRS